MALLDFLKRKKEIEKAKKPEIKTAEVKVEKKLEPKLNRKAGSFSYSVIKEPHISEKGTNLSEKNNQYIFNVLQGANKAEIKKSIEGVYGVNVLLVNIIKIPHKKRRIGKTQGFKKAYTKAIVKLQTGQKIEIL